MAQQAKTTEIGKTQIAQWQKLPSTLLREFCKKERRPNPKFKDLESSSKDKFKYRCIVPDAKNADKDLFFVPAQAVANEEQAKEESALLGLLMLTPSLPHERKLPEPYKTTWLNAVQAQKKNGKVTGDAQKSNTPGNSSKTPTNEGTQRDNKKATSSNLVSGSKFTSNADRKRQQEQKRQARNARIRKHEAIRMANRDHPVFLSAQLRQQIQRILKGDTNVTFSDDAETGDNVADLVDETTSDRQAYVEDRLHNEGFTKKQARMAFQSVSTSTKHTDEEEEWEKQYDECLQWLCIHLEEDELPEGFDPRGQTLDVVAAPKSRKEGTIASQATLEQELSREQKELADQFGLSVEETKEIAASSTNQNADFKDLLWKSACDKAKFEHFPTTETSAEISSLFQDEQEALEAIFPSDCQVVTDGNISRVCIATPEELTIDISIDNRSYPMVHPQRILFSGKWPKKVGLRFHVEIAKFLSSLVLGEPMIFEVYGQMQSLLQDIDALDPPSSEMVKNKIPDIGKSHSATTDVSSDVSKKRKRLVPFKRPRHRGFFWLTSPQKTPPADAHPKVSSTLERQRRSLPAWKARDEFLSILKKADSSSRVVLVTGDTGCGKTTQIPQFILEERPMDYKIVVAQPRRLAATGVAGRVAEERGEARPGTGSVGYAVRGDTAVCESTRLLFCTFGILLRQLQCEGALESVTHIVIDEVHERNLDGDVLMDLLKKLLRSNPRLRVVLMSATLDADRFASYWGDDTQRINIPGRTFPVEDFILEDVLSMTGYVPPKNPKKKGHRRFDKSGPGSIPRKATPWNDSEFSDEDEESNEESKALSEPKPRPSSVSVASGLSIGDLVQRVDEQRIDYDMLGQLVKHLIQTNEMGHNGSILVFLPGAPEINQAKSTLETICRGMKVLLLPLHGGLQPKDQNVVFRPAENATKVILSTNVAETSITSEYHEPLIFFFHVCRRLFSDAFVCFYA